MSKDFTELIDLASERVGGAALAASDEFFAPKKNLLKPSPPVFIEDKYTDRGKWMDGWETRRRRGPGHDWCIIRLGLPGIIRGLVVDTSFFKGNYPAQCSMEALAVEPTATAKPLLSASAAWVQVLPPTDLKGDTQHLLPIESPYRFTHIHFNIFPDGGVARLRVFGEVVPDWKRNLSEASAFDLAAAENGGLVVAASDMFFGSRQNLILPGRAKSMSEGWETRRRRGPGNDWAVIKLGTTGEVQRVEVDTSYFKGNFPESCSLDGCAADEATGQNLLPDSVGWKEVLPRTKLKSDRRHLFEKEIAAAGPLTHIRFNIFPDGGVSRLRVIGRISSEGRHRAGLQWLNALLEPAAETALHACCGSPAWARRMTGQRPFSSVHRLLEAADEVWRELRHEDWLEAFRAHPRIGGKRREGKGSAVARRWSVQEQAGARKVTAKQRAALEEANRAYEARFGHIFIVCATGKSSQEMLALLRQRLQNDPQTELGIAAEEQRRIMQIRLEKLLHL